MVSSNYSEKELKEMFKKASIKLRKQRLKAINLATEYILGTSQQNVCDFLNSGKLDVNKGFLWGINDIDEVKQK